MNPRTKRVLALGLAAVVLVAALAAILWARMPRTFEQAMGNDFDWANITRVQADLTPKKDGEDFLAVEFSPDDPAYEELMEWFQAQKYYLHPANAQQMNLDYRMVFWFESADQQWWLAATGDAPVFISDQLTVSASGGEAFQQELLDFLLGQPYTRS